jgi:predicted ester cyclase
MTPDELRALAQSVYDAINAQDVEALDDLFAHEIVRHAAGEIGIEHAKRAMANAFVSSPDLRFEVEDLIAEGDRVALRVTVHRNGPDGHDAPSTILEIFRVENGKVAEIWGAGAPSRAR